MLSPQLRPRRPLALLRRLQATAVLVCLGWAVPAARAACAPGAGGGPCTLSNGCPGVYQCVNTTVRCICDGGGSVKTCGNGYPRANSCYRSGQQQCDASCTPTGPCSACVAETCDGCDNDCDGVVDNAPGSSQPNTLSEQCGGPAHCSVQGSRVCVNGQFSDCTGCGGTGDSCTTACGSTGAGPCNATCRVPVAACFGPEVCNGCDDNGNGVVDEGLSCQPCAL